MSRVLQTGVTTDASQVLQTAYVLFGDGQRDERRPDDLGTAHLIEHLLHSRGGSISDGVFADFARLGVEANAYTAPDYVAVYARLPPERLADWARRTWESVDAPAISRAAIAQEVTVIAREVRSKVVRNPFRGFPHQHLRQVLFEDFANGHEGFVDHAELRDIDVDRLRVIHDTTTDPARAVAHLAGPLAAEDVGDALLGTGFEVVTRADVRKGPRREAVPTGPTQVRVARIESSPYGAAATFIADLAGDPLATLAALHLVACMLGQGPGNRLAGVPGRPPLLRLVAQVGLGGDSCEDLFPTALSVFGFSREPVAATWVDDAARTALTDLRNGCRDDELVAGRNYLTAGLVAKLESPLNRCKMEAWFGRNLGSSVAAFLAAVAATSWPDLVRVVDSLTGQPRRTIELS